MLRYTEGGFSVVDETLHKLELAVPRPVYERIALPHRNKKIVKVTTVLLVLVSSEAIEQCLYTECSSILLVYQVYDTCIIS